MTLKLYYIPASFPVRSVLLCAKALNLELEFIYVDLLKGEQKSPEFTKLNPQQTVPVLDDDGFIIWDSHVINTYLIRKYGKDDSLYPEDFQQRAIVDQRLHFDCAVFFPSVLWICKGINLYNLKVIPQDKIDEVLHAYELVELFLKDTDYIAGKNVTVADLSIITTLTTVNILIPVDSKRFPKITAYIKRMESLPFYEANIEGLQQIKELLTKNLAG